MKTVNSRRIKEALSLQELTPEEKEKRGILGRLYGTCASIAIPTRNGRFYDEKLWENQFENNEILKELINNGGCPMELDHPVDREETDSTKIAAMLNSMPQKDENGNLICSCDIIDTPCGRIAYQLAKYGFKLGISSRATGDTYTRPDGTEGIDPDTFQLTTFDLVLVPALKNARLSLTESYNSKKKKLVESLQKEVDSCETEDDKKIMKEELKRLNINLNEDLEDPKTFAEFVAVNNEDELEDAAKSEAEYREENKEALQNINDKLEALTDAISKIAEAKDEKPDEEPIEEFSEEEPVEESAEENIEEPVESSEEEPITEEENEEAIDEINPDEVIAEEEKNSSDDNIDKDESEQSEEDEEPVDEAEDFENLDQIKESLLNKYAAQDELDNTKSKLAVSEAKVKTLEEELNNYKAASMKLSRIAKGAKSLKKESLRLEEELSKNKELLKNLKTENNSLKEGLETSDKDAAYEELCEKVKKVLAEAKEKLLGKNKEIQLLKEELDNSKEKLDKVNSEKDNLENKNEELQEEKEELLEKYINLKSSSLGISRKAINEGLHSRSIEEIDRTCNRLQGRQTKIGSLPFNLNEGLDIEYKKPAVSYRENDDYFEEDDFDSIAKLN